MIQKTSIISRGRPKGITEGGAEMRQHLYFVAIELINDVGYEKATLRKMATLAGVSPGLFYKYFPSKEALVFELHETLTSDFEHKAQYLKDRKWADRTFEVLKLSLESLKPHRETLVSFRGVLVGSRDKNVFSGFSKFSQQRVQAVFERAITESTNPIAKDLILPLARLGYLIHMAILLFWLFDQSEKQKSTDTLIDLMGRWASRAQFVLKLPGAKKLVIQLDQIIDQALFPS